MRAILSLAVLCAIGVCEIVHIDSTPGKAPGDVTLSFSFESTPFSLDLEPDNLFPDNIAVQSEDGTMQHWSVPQCFYSGGVRDVAHSVVAVSVCDGLVEGMILAPGYSLNVQPDAASGEHLVQRSLASNTTVDDDDMPDMPADTLPSPGLPGVPGPQGAAGAPGAGEELTIQLNLVFDQSYQNSGTYNWYHHVQASVALFKSAMAGIGLTFNIRIPWRGYSLDLFPNNPAGLTSKQLVNSFDAHIDLLRAYPDVAHFDTAMLFTALDTGTSIGKVKDIGAMCSHDSASFINPQNAGYGGDFAGVARVWTHEMAHLLGMQHDGYYPNGPCLFWGYIMQSSDVSSATEFSSCSRSNINAWLAHEDWQCLRTTIDVCGATYSLDATIINHSGCSGTIPAGVSELNKLTKLRMSLGTLSGTIPRLPYKLQDLQVNTNQLHGTIPQLPSTLQTFAVYQNQLTGTIPPFPPSVTIALLLGNHFDCPVRDYSAVSVYNDHVVVSTECESAVTYCGQSFAYSTATITANMACAGPLPTVLPALKRFVAANKLISGTLDAIVSWKGLVDLNVQGNHLTGTLPALGDLFVLSSLDVRFNQLTGTVSSLPASLVFLAIGRNPLHGSLPVLSAMPQLRTAILSNAQFSGTIPSLISMAHLGRLYVDNNQLTGYIPFMHDSLQWLYAQNNQLIGRIFVIPYNMQRLLVQNNQIGGFFPLYLGSQLQHINLSNNRFMSAFPSLPQSTADMYTFMSGNHWYCPTPWGGNPSKQWPVGSHCTWTKLSTGHAGADLASGTKGEDVDCAEWCQDTPGCAAWSRAKSTNTCHLSAHTTLQPGGSGWVTAKKAPQQQCGIEHGVACPGNDLTWYNSGDPQWCCQKCHDHPQCNYWTVQIQNARCLLKTACTHPTDNGDRISGHLV